LQRPTSKKLDSAINMRLVDAVVRAEATSSPGDSGQGLRRRRPLRRGLGLTRERDTSTLSARPRAPENGCARLLICVCMLTRSRVIRRTERLGERHLSGAGSFAQAPRVIGCRTLTSRVYFGPTTAADSLTTASGGDHKAKYYKEQMHCSHCMP